MAKYRVLKRFRDIKNGKVYKPNTVIEMTVKRAKEAENNLKEFGGSFFKRIEEKGDE